MWVFFGLYLIIVITKSADTNSVKYYGVLQDEDQRCRNKDGSNHNNNNNNGKNRFSNFIVKGSEESILIVPKAEEFDQPTWRMKIHDDSQVYNTQTRKTKKSLAAVGSHNGASYHMELHQPAPPYKNEINCQNPNHRKERRNPTFNPWGGKRNSIGFKPDPKIRRPARVPFNSWGGKRQGETFLNSNWQDEVAKKRINDATGIKKPFNSWGGKRSPFVTSIYSHEQLFDNGVKTFLLISK